MRLAAVAILGEMATFADAGVSAVTLRQGDFDVYGPMPLSPS